MFRLYILLGAIFPIVVAFSISSIRYYTAVHKQELFSSLCQEIHKKISAQSVNTSIQEAWQKRDQLFLHHTFATKTWLRPEQEFLQHHIQQSLMPEDIIYAKRLHMLTTDNILSFVEGASERSKGYAEVIEQQDRPIEINSTDLQEILALLEQPHNTRPHMIVLESVLERKNGIISEVWAFSVKLLRREYTQ